LPKLRCNVILSDRSIEKRLRENEIVVDPLPDSAQYDSSSLNLRVGDDFLYWKERLAGTTGIAHNVEVDNIHLHDLLYLTEPLSLQANGTVAIPPGAFVLVRTLEYVKLPIKSKLAARVEGRSKQARLGMGVHITAPTIHAGFAGKIVLEIINHGPFHLVVRPNQSRICQLIFEKVDAVPERGGSAAFGSQSTPLGAPKPR
jgi:dCTP deaminase